MNEKTEKNKMIAILSYIIFFLPFLTETKNDNFVMFHANQSLVLLISGVVVSIIFGFLMTITFNILNFLSSILGFVYIGFLVIGMMNAYNGEMKKLPIIGDIEILK